MGVKEFKEKLMADEAFAAKFKGVTTAEQLVELAAKEGYNFTVDDVNNNELTDAELEAAAGGKAILASGWFVDSKSILATGYFVSKD